MQTKLSLVMFLTMFDGTLRTITALSLKLLFRGSFLAQGPRTITGCMKAAWPWADKHWTVYENVLRKSKFDSRKLACTLFQNILKLMPPRQTIILIFEETLVRRYGPRVVGVNRHRDAVRTSKNVPAITSGHKWINVAVSVKSPFVSRVLALPILSLLYTTKKQARRNHADRPYLRHRKVGDLAKILVTTVMRWASERRFCLVGDGAYGTHDLADALNEASAHPTLGRCSLVSRFRLDAATYKKAPSYSGNGRPRIKGGNYPRLLSLQTNRGPVFKKPD